MSFRAVRAGITVATAAVVTAALLTPRQVIASAPVAAAPDTVHVTGTVLVLAGEHGESDRYSLLLPSGRTIELADGFTAEPMSRLVGSLVVPGTGTGRRLTGSKRAGTLRRAASSSTPLKVVGARVAEPAPSPGPTHHTTYVAKVTNLGPIDLTDAQVLETVNASQAYWVRESAGQIPSWTTSPSVVPIATTAGSVANGCGLGAGGADFGAVTRDVGNLAYPGVDFSGSSPHHLVVVVPHGCGGGISGRARIGASFANGGPVIIDARPQPQPTLDHEYGHNVGLQHANNGVEYGDVYEVMGAAEDAYPSPVLGTVYRWEEGIIGAGEVVDGTAGGSWTLAPRSSAGGLRSVAFIDPDTGRRHFVDHRDGSGADAGACYSSGSCDYTQGYGQTYTPGITVEREDDASGAFLLKPDASNDGALQGDEAWSNASGTLTVRGDGAGVSVTRAAAPHGTVAGGAATMGAPTALRDVTATPSGFVPTPAGYRYQWTLDGRAVPGAEDPTFRPTVAMAGKALSVVVTAYAAGYEPLSRTAPAQTVAPATWHTRGARTSPEITGLTRVGGTLRVLGLDWVNYHGAKPADLTTTYQWSRNGKTIPGATAATYRLTSRDHGTTIRVSEYPRAAGYGTTSLGRSPSSATIRLGRLTTTRTWITGKVRVGKRVVARTKGWTRGTKFRYRWLVGKRAVRGATGKKLRITRSMKGKKLVVKVTGKKTGYQRSSATSHPKRVRGPRRPSKTARALSAVGGRP